MDQSPPNTSVPRRIPSTYERTVHCLRDIRSYLRRCRNHRMVRAVQHIIRPVWRRHERNAAEETEEEIYQALYHVVESIERFQETVERTTDRQLEVNVEIPIIIPPPGRERAVVDIRLPINQIRPVDANRDVIRIRILEGQNGRDHDDPWEDSPDSRFTPLQNVDEEFFDRLTRHWARYFPSDRQDGEEHLLDLNNDEMALGEGIAGATEEEVERLALVSATHEHTTEVCTICLEDFEVNADVRMLPCGHVFHPECARDWLLRNPTCPIDRTSIFEDS